MSDIRIDCCVCTRQPFAQLLQLARAGRVDDLPELVALTGAGGQCGLCRPYLRKMLATGQTCFTELLPDGPDIDPSADDPGPG